VDPELARLIDKAISVVGTILGAIIGLIGSLTVAQINQRGQREIASEAALREDRKSLMAPFLEWVHSRVELYAQLSDAARTNEREKALAIIHQMTATYPSHDTRWFSAGSEEFNNAAIQFIEVDLGHLKQLVQHARAAVNVEQLACTSRDAMANLREPAFRVQRAAERYAYPDANRLAPSASARPRWQFWRR
jgi:hypothetical protein